MDEGKKQDGLRPRFAIEKRKIRDTDVYEKIRAFGHEKVLYVDIDDEITHVFDAIKKTPAKKIAIVVPRKAVLFQSLLNMKILLKKTGEVEKEIIMITSDPTGLKYAEKLGILAAEQLQKKAVVRDTFANDKIPLKSERPTKRVNEKISISEVIKINRPHGIQTILESVRDKMKKKKQEMKGTKLVFSAPNKQALFTLILVSVMLFLAIAYIALPGATVYLTPRPTVLEQTFNVNFLDPAKNGDLENARNQSIVVASYPIEAPPFTKKVVHFATGKISKGNRSRGVITVTNTSPNPWDLAEKTRFQTEDGIVFRTPTAVRIPPARGAQPGTLDIAVIADELDANLQVIGSRGNIPPTTFFLPGLKNEENRKKLTATSKAAMTGGETSVVKVISQEDVDAAQSEIVQKINKEAAADLKSYLEQQNLVKKTSLSLLNDSHVITIGKPTVTVPPGLVGTSIDQFELSASYTMSGLAFNYQELVDQVKERLLSRVDPDKKILTIDEKDLSYRYLDGDEANGRRRITVTMRALQVYDLDPETENGKRFLKKVTDHIAGLRIEAAQEYLQQQTEEIQDVQVKTWPIWAPTIPSIGDNIKYVIQEARVLN
ncbi:hypothetical protein KBD59_00255 [Candidatus Gracilibacteria bacterium]|nr:hypothetical protein [Candidatus Gracilibacteria bacterium]